MAAGSNTYEGLAVPLLGESEIKQQTAANDVITVTGASAQTGAFITCQNNSSTAKFVVTKDGAISTLAEVAVTGSAASAVLFKGTQTGTATGLAIQINNSSGSKIFSVLPAGGIRTMVAFSTLAVASISSGGSASYTVTGATTDDAVFFIPLKVPTVNNGVLQAFAQGADRVDFYVGGLSSSSYAANTVALWLLRTVANSATNT